MSDRDFADYLLVREGPEQPPFARADVYRRLVRGAFRSVLIASFPRTCEVVGADNLLAEFLDAGGPSTPFYRDIPGDLVLWAGATQHRYADLLQWEQLDRVAARHPADVDNFPGGAFTPNPTMQLAAYARPVEKISREEPSPALFAGGPMAYAVWRRPRTDETETHRMGLLLARGLALAAGEVMTIEQIAEHLAKETPALTHDAIAASLRELERDLRERDGLL